MSSMRDRVKQAKNGTPKYLLDIYNAWRLARPEHQFSDEALAMAIDILKRREKGYKKQRNSPSAANHCLRQSVISFMGYKSSNAGSARVQGLFDGGNFGHLKWQMYLYDMGVLVKAEVPVSMPGWQAAGTCDGIVEIPLKGYRKEMTRQEVRDLCTSGEVPVWRGVLEIKMMGSFRFRNVKAANEPEEKVRWQGDLYALSADRYDHDIDGTVYWFESRDTAEVIEYSLPVSDKALGDMTEFYGEVYKHTSKGILPSRPYKSGSTPCNGCFYEKHCDAFERKGKTEIKPAKGAKMGDFQIPKSW